MPNSSENKISGLHDGEIKIKLRAKPIDGEANKAVVDFLSKTLNLSKKSILIRRGELSRHKQIEILVDLKDEALILKKLSI